MRRFRLEKTMSDEIERKMKAFDSDVTTALKNCIAEAGPILAERHGVLPAFASGALPSIFIRTGIELHLADSECTDEEIDQLFHHVCYMLNGAT
jgi:hypothetical protein